jgi:hypothetical protein
MTIQQWSLQVLFQELAVPTMAVLKDHGHRPALG